MGRPFVASSSQQETSAADAAVKKALTLEKWRACLSGISDSYDDSTVDAVLEWMYAKKKLAYSMKVEQPRASMGRTPSSKLGGLPFLLPGESWPTSTHSGSDGTELMFVWQFVVSDLPVAMRDMLGYQEGLFQFFVDEELSGYDIIKDKGYYLVRVLTAQQLAGAAANTSTAMAEPDSGTKVLTEQAVLSWEEVDDWPHYEDWDTEAEGANIDKQAFDTILEALHNGPGDGEAHCVGGDKALGWPRWCQGPEWGEVEEEGEVAGSVRRRRYLQFLQFESEFSGNEWLVGDCGTLVIQRDPLGKEPPEFLVGWACC